MQTHKHTHTRTQSFTLPIESLPLAMPLLDEVNNMNLCVNAFQLESGPACLLAYGQNNGIL